MASTQQSISTRSRPTVSSRISAVGAKIARALSRDRDITSRPGYDPETESLASTVVERGESSIPRYNPLDRGGRRGSNRTCGSTDAATRAVHP
jgi:hypothetical protein